MTLALVGYYEAWWIQILKAIVIFAVGLQLVPVVLIAERKLLGRFQSRYGPNRVGPYGALQPMADILKLPLMNWDFSVGNNQQPPPFQQGNAELDNTFHFYWEDSWKIKPNFTVNYGLGWNFESNALNHDLVKPEWLAPIFGAGGLGHEQHDYKHFSPMLGFAWSPWKDNKTVFRGGAGVYYDTIDIELRLIERS